MGRREFNYDAASLKNTIGPAAVSVSVYYVAVRTIVLLYIGTESTLLQHLTHTVWSAFY